MGHYNETPTVPGIIGKIHERLARLERTYAFPRYSTASLPAASLMEGQVVYDTTVKKLKGSDGTSWNVLW